MPPARCTSSMWYFCVGRRHLGQAGHAARHAVDVRHGEIDPGLLRGGQQVQHGVGRAAHGDVEADGVFEGARSWRWCAAGRRRRPVRNSAWHSSTISRPALRNSILRSACVASSEPLPGSDRPSASVRQFIELAVNMPEQEPQVGQAERSMASDFLVGHPCCRRPRPWRRPDRPCGYLAVPLHLAGLHRPAGDEHGRDVEPQRRHQHARGDLVAVGDADHGVGAVGIDHVLDRVGDQFARGQRIQHAAVAHGDAVVDGDGVELLGHAAGRLDLARHQLAHVLQMHMARHELGEGIDHGDDGLAEVAVLHAGGAPQGAGAGHVAAVGGGAGTVGGHGNSEKEWRGPAILTPSRQGRVSS